MSLYIWDTLLYNAIRSYFPRCLKSKWKEKRLYNMGIVNRISLRHFKMYVENADIYFAGIQIVLNLGFTQIRHSPLEYGILPHPSEDLKHVRKYTCTSSGGQMDYYHPFKNRTIIFE